MKGDLSRSTFRPDNHYSSVRLQQGRVLLDAEWNEQAEIWDHLGRTTNTDVIGPTGAPKHPLTERVHFAVDVGPGGTDLAIGPGRIYVDGIQCETAATTFSDPARPARRGASRRQRAVRAVPRRVGASRHTGRAARHRLPAAPRGRPRRPGHRHPRPGGVAGEAPADRDEGVHVLRRTRRLHRSAPRPGRPRRRSRGGLPRPRGRGLPPSREPAVPGGGGGGRRRRRGRHLVARQRIRRLPRPATWTPPPSSSSWRTRTRTTSSGSPPPGSSS